VESGDFENLDTSFMTGNLLHIYFHILPYPIPPISHLFAHTDVELVWCGVPVEVSSHLKPQDACSHFWM
jgi:hypothetical protein